MAWPYRERAERGCSCDSRPQTGPCPDRDGQLRRLPAIAILPVEQVRPSSDGTNNLCVKAKQQKKY